MEYLPTIKEDLKLIETSVDENGSKQWLIFDPSGNRYISIGVDSFELLNLWKPNMRVDEFIDILGETDINLDKSSLNIFLNFLSENDLIKIDNKERLDTIYNKYKKSRSSLLKWLIHNYLFIRIPLVNPNNWLSRNISRVEFLYTDAYRNFVLFIGFIGIVLTLRDFDSFVGTFDYFFTIGGIFYYVVSLIFVKIIHELGHAFTAKRYGCKVPAMGVAFLVLFPVLYTDTTDSWKIRSRYKRLNIVLAGVKTELYLALIATFLWSFLPDGVLKSIAFVVATTSWITSVLVNISPFLRFDGYYVLSDITDTKNLQPRAFAMARWYLREFLFGLDESKPERIDKSKERFFIVYAFLTWIYRFLLFLGIALMVYYFAFKVLGIVLFVVEIVYFILIPIFGEMRVWWSKSITMNFKLFRTFVILVGLVFVLVYPWKSSVYVPAILESQSHTTIKALQKAQVDKILIKDKQLVKEGQTVLILKSDYLNQKISEIKIEIELLKLRLNNAVNSSSIDDNKIILEDRLSKKMLELYSLRKSREELVVKAPFDGTVKLADVGVGMYVNKESSLFDIYDQKNLMITGFCNEYDKNLISIKSRARFVGDDNSNIRAIIKEISDISVSNIEYKELTSMFGGDIAVIENKDTLLTKGSYFKMYLYPDIGSIRHRQKGVLIIESESSSLIEKVYNKSLSILIRESGF
jgi:putative peptide zinc metalloprotease protein